MNMTQAEAGIELAILDARAQELDQLDALTRLTNAGLPQEVVLRLQELWDRRAEIGDRVIHVGRIVAAEIFRFVEENPNLAIGLALGAAVAALLAMIPVVGPFLMPLAIALGIIAGHKSDEGEKAKTLIIGVPQDIIAIARKFFELLASIFNALRGSGAELQSGDAK